MVPLLVYAVTLLVVAVVSELARTTLLSAAALFLLAGALAGGLAGVRVHPDDPLLHGIAALSLFAILFTDGMRANTKELREGWRLWGRALAIGMPLTIAAMALLAHVLLGLPWIEALLLGAILGPTDPAFAAALIGREDVPLRLRRMINVESGLNDGLALPLVLALLAMTQGAPLSSSWFLAALGGSALGVVLVWVGVHVERLPMLAAAAGYRRYFVLALGLLVLATARLTGTNDFLAAFAGGVTLASLSGELAGAFRELGEGISDLLKFAGVLAFGTVISLNFMARLSTADYVFVALAVIAVRPMMLMLTLLGSRLRWRERAVAAWYGPKGFASVVYAILILESGAPRRLYLFHVAAAVVAASMVLHSSTDVVAARWLKRHERASS